MPLYKFGVGDVFYNQIKAHPSCSFFIYRSNIYLNDRPTETGAFVANAGGVPTGHVSLFEMNIDRTANSDESLVIGPSSSEGPKNVPDTGIIFPFIYKDRQRLGFKGISRKNWIHNYSFGDVITGSYVMSSSISRRLYTAAMGFNDTNITGSALKNSLDFAKRLGDHYNYESGSSKATTVIQIPSIFYGSEIKKGSVNLRFFLTGTLAAELKDSQHNGALIQHNGEHASAYDGEIAGSVLYKEGFIILTGSWSLDTAISDLSDVDSGGSSLTSDPNWLRFGVGANDLVNEIGANGSASFAIDFQGTHKIPTVTMLAHANRGELNYSNNPTYIQHGQIEHKPITGSHYYGENELKIKNVFSSSYADPSGSLKKTTYITKVGIYDDKKKLIGIASVAKPVKKTEERDLTFKLKLDI